MRDNSIVILLVSVGVLIFVCGGVAGQETLKDVVCTKQCGEHWTWEDEACVCLEKTKTVGEENKQQP